ncbi:hypothetical protein BRAO285_610002 [Bradyrhizobium sp. ORS 285]|nr:hypothetical protein BRAO285_610002 [Bradyrhizobium sp. ORS 285]
MGAVGSIGRAGETTAAGGWAEEYAVTAGASWFETRRQAAALLTMRGWHPKGSCTPTMNTPRGVFMVGV